MNARLALLILSCPTLAACATFLHVREGAPSDRACGIVVNERATYAVAVESQTSALKVAPPKGPLRGVDNERVLSVGVIRMPFASGELGLKLTEGQQILKEVTLSSQPGTTKMVDAAKAGLGADTDVRNALAPTATPTP